MAILLKGCKVDGFQSHGSLKLSFTSIQVLYLNFVECKFFLESNSPDILALCVRNLDDSIDSGNFSIRGFFLYAERILLLMHGLAVHMKEGLPFAQDLILENSADSYVCFQMALLHLMSYFFFPSITFLAFMLSFWFYFIKHTWGSLSEPHVFMCLSLNDMKKFPL